MPSKFNRAGSFIQADIEDFVKANDKRILGLMRQSITDVTNEAQQPVAKGGRMRVKTGFLRASGQPSLTGLPSGPGRGELEADNSYDWDADSLNAILAKMEVGDVFYFGWTANYAEYREVYDGFLESSLQNWGRIVAFNTDTLRKRIKS